MMDKVLPSISPAEIWTYPPDPIEIPGFNATLEMPVAIQAKRADEPGKLLHCNDTFQALKHSFSGIVLDGVGTTEGVDVTASKAATEMMLVLNRPDKEKLLPESETQALVAEALITANTAVFNSNKTAQEPTTTTAVVARLCALENAQLGAVVGWVGDSRAHLLGPAGEVVQITVDDNICLDACKGDLELAKAWQARFQAAGREGFKVLFMEFYGSVQPPTNFLELIKQVLDAGQDDKAFKNFNRIISQSIGEQAEIKPHLATVSLPPGWSILLSSDGITDVLPQDQLNQAPEELVKAADSETGSAYKNDDRVALRMEIKTTT